MAEGCGCEKDSCQISIQNPLAAVGTQEPLYEATELRTGAANPHWSRRLIQPCLPQKVVAEMVGTFAIVFAGCGAVVVNARSDGALGHVGIAATFGLVVMVMIYAVGHISGAHFNPAVTLAFACGRHFSWKMVPFYWAAQFLSATAGAALIRGILGSEKALGATLPSGTDWESLLLEFVLTFFLMFVIAAVATDTRAVGTMAGIAIGGTVALDALFGGPVSGASMNPARSLGPALIALEFRGLWVYFVGPAAGAVSAIFVYKFVHGPTQEVARGAHGCCE
ncbi:Nodulin-26 like Intrinsic Protein [Klebsormidium nitens]|uniref:Nodulin-26 like Intrinsic Protein n=1 Tax=Klebsormidium nitens TaxID=105231 RepID=A0A1Y1HQJ4_KLENI|nr:Nodulin-26 like Intrinsic Protein [Klebsormidium nitens]|eukprot:GAQ78837.1 Nodulin-26 like Intrinsic Protein [Klebsormidium nitens]